jgi:tetratricopeptide (TPR) repeat protein
MVRRFWMFLVVAILGGAIGGMAEEDSLSRGERALAEKNYAAAEALLRRAVAGEPGSSRARSELALALLAQDKLDEGLAEAKQALDLAPGDANVLFRYGLALADNGRAGEAAAAFEHVVRAMPNAPFPLRALAFAYADAGDDRAIAVFESLLKLYARDVDIRRRFAKFLWEIGQNERGDAIIEEALRLAPDNAALHALYGSHLPIEGRFVTAARELARARDLGLATAAILGQLGDAQWNAGQLEDAARSFEEAIAADPGNFVARMETGRLLVWMGRPAEAVGPLEKAAELAPGSMSAQLELGRAREAAGDLSAAESAYRRAVALDPQLSKTHYALGLLLAKRGRAAESREELRTAGEQYEAERRQMFQEGSLHVECNLAWVELKHGDAASALDRFRRLPESPEVLTGLGAALSRLGRHPEALKAFEKAHALAPEDRKTTALLSREYELAGARP